MYNVMGSAMKSLIFISLCVSVVNAKRRDRFDIIEKRMSVVESRVSADKELAKEMFVTLQQNFDEFNNSIINFKDQMCPIMDQQTGKKEQTNSAKRVEHLKSSQVLVLLGLKREKQWTRNQMKNLTILLTEHSAQLEKHFENLTDQIHLQNDQLTNKVSLKSETTEQLINTQQREIETLKETQAKLLNGLISANLINLENLINFENLIDFTCPSDWTKYSSYCYLYVGEKKRFSEARAHCKRLGATLSDIENKAENTFIGGLAGYWNVWIGYSDEKEEGTWISERTGQPASFTNFGTGEPDGDTRENCAVMSNSDGLWHDYLCDHKFTFVCKKNAKMDIKF